MKPKSNKNTTQPRARARGAHASRVQARTSRPSSPAIIINLARCTWHSAQKQKPNDARTVLVSSDEAPFPVWFGYWAGWCPGCKKLWLDNEGYELPFTVNHWADFPRYKK